MARPARRLLLLTAVALVILAATTAALWPSQICPTCHGFTISHNRTTRAGQPDPSGLAPCDRCDGRGAVSVLNVWFGPVHKD